MFGDVWLEIEPNPGGGVEFAEKVVGGSVPEGLLPGRREGHPRGGRRGRARRLSAVRLQGDALRRLVPHGRLERAVVQDRGVDGAQGRRPRGASRSSSSRSWRSRSGPRGSTWARSTATSTAGAAGCSGMDTDGGDADHHGPRAPGRALHLRDRAAVADPRARHVHRGARPLRGRAGHIAEKVIEAHQKELEASRAGH